MHDISDNRFIAEFYGKEDLSLNSFLFNGHTASKHVSYDRFYKSVYNLLATLSFNIHMTAYKYLAALAVMYLAFDRYQEDTAIEMVMDHYGVDADHLLADLRGLIERNTDFISAASRLLNTQLYPRDCTCISDVIEIIGAIFKLYYNYTVDVNELIDNSVKAMPISRCFQNAK